MPDRAGKRIAAKVVRYIIAPGENDWSPFSATISMTVASDVVGGAAVGPVGDGSP